jgi:MFS family permease
MTGTAAAEPLARRPSAWGPLRVPIFRILWTATVASNVGSWMHDTAATWLMTSLTTSTLLVALMQTASSLPVLLLSLPAGALADIVDRRRVLIVAQSWMLAAAGLMGLLALAGAMTPDRLLFFTFVLGLGNGLTAPAWQATLPDLVGKDQLAPAVSLNGAAMNIARAVGPAVGGLLVAAITPGGVFLLNAASFAAVIVALARWNNHPHESMLPAERVLGAIGAGWRYLRHAPQVQAALMRCALFVLFASAPWALLPVLARYELGLGALGYGVLYGCLGLGALTGVAFLPRVQARRSTDGLVLGATAVYAAAVAVLALARAPAVAGAALFSIGIAWITVMPAFNVATQRASAEWVKARMLAMYVLMYMGGMALGAALWGTVATHLGITGALLAAAAGLLLSFAAAARWSLGASDRLDLAPSGHWRDPVVTGDLHQDEGPVLVTVEYRVAPEDGAAFARAMRGVGQLRRRDGAVSWGLFRDTADPWRWVETFVAESWGEHLRQHARATMADLATEAAARRYHRGGGLPAVAHFVHADTSE